MPALNKLGQDLRIVDRLIVDLVARRQELASFVGHEKKRNGDPMYRPDIEQKRLDDIAEHAARNRVDPHFARALLYSLIGESCKHQTIQFQSDGQPDLEGMAEDEKWRTLRANLMRLTQIVSEVYDKSYFAGHLASRFVSEFEDELIRAEASAADPAGLAVDIGCGTGAIALNLTGTFAEVVGYDLSQHMLYQADRKRDALGISNVRFERIDAEDGLPLGDGTASFIVMNLGTASEIANIDGLIAEIDRTLAPGGRFFLSFYNADSLLSQCGYLPWAAGLAAAVNPYTGCLDVRISNEVLPIFAKAYTEEMVRTRMPPGWRTTLCVTYPVLTSMLPDDFLTGLPDPTMLDLLDRRISTALQGSFGAYLMVAGQKET